MSLHHVQVGTCHGHLCTVVCAAWDVSFLIPVPVFPPAGAAAAGIDVCLGEGAHVGMSAAGAWSLRPRVAWGAPGALPCCSHVLCQMGLAFPWKYITPAPDAGLLPVQSCRSSDSDAEQ